MRAIMMHVFSGCPLHVAVVMHVFSGCPLHVADVIADVRCMLQQLADCVQQLTTAAEGVCSVTVLQHRTAHEI
jgi:hypothetical protein